jgi:hypothetical protein
MQAVEGPYAQGFNAGMRAAEKLRRENRIYREALEELAANRHSFQRPAGQIAREALDAASSEEGRRDD